MLSVTATWSMTGNLPNEEHTESNKNLNHKKILHRSLHSLNKTKDVPTYCSKEQACTNGNVLTLVILSLNNTDINI